ncbi:MAG: protein translocase subunit SecF [Deltaproteobacteria bacterium]|nr:protein translocase subunit SecF [Deltaproteobacteria bacterium]
MELIRRKTNIDFMGLKWVSMAISLVLVAIAVFFWVKAGDAKYGVDFRGGNEFVVHFEKPMPLGTLRGALEKAGFTDAVVQKFEDRESDFSVRVGARATEDLTASVRAVFQGISENSYQILREDFVGPVIGEQIRRDALIAGVIGLIGIMLYVTIRFSFIFAFGAVFALTHDAIIAAGATVLSGREIGAATLAAVLTIIGYSVNDTIIIYDRIRENLAKANKTGSAAKKGEAAEVHGKSMAEIINLSINETLSRTIITSVTVVFVCLTLWLFGGGAVSDLAFTLLVGILIGTYSSVYVASPSLLIFAPKKK